MCTDASMRMERLQDALAKADPVSENGQEEKTEVAVDIRSLQKPLKEQYLLFPQSSWRRPFAQPVAAAPPSNRDSAEEKPRHDLRAGV